MVSTELVYTAAVLGLVNHVYFHKFEPLTAHWPLLIVGVQPFILVFSLHTFNLVNVLTATTVLLATLFTSIGIYRAGPWHPLANIPGPFWARVSKYWSLGVLLTGEKHVMMKRLHEQYGDVVRVGPNEVSIAHVDGIRNVFGTSGFQKGPFYDTWSDPTLPTKALLNLRGDAHANRRRIWNRGMNTEGLKGFEHVLAKRLVILLSQFDKIAKSGPGNNKLDLAAWFSYLTFDFMGDLAFGGPFNMLRDGGDKDGMWAIVGQGAKATAIISQIPWLVPTFNGIPGANYIMDRLRAFAQQSSENRIKSGVGEHKDLWYHLMDEEGHEKRTIPVHDVVVDGVLAIVAGSDTAAIALTYFFYRMLLDRKIYERVQAEVDSVYPDAESCLDSDRHDDLKFLSACIQESLRLFPPVPTGGPRKIPKGESRVVAGKLIAPETQIYVPAYVIQRSPVNFFPAPDSYDPDRWLRSSEHNVAENETLDYSAFIPFSYGAANCAAKHLAWRQLLMTLSAVLKKYDIKFLDPESKTGKDWESTMHDFYVTETGPLMVEVTLRK
ncbi:Peroxisomal hydratase-dehydrogenase-epimerase [Mycena chlorophos]|uniref:Peroxisomal hydratase-dehydrogenase-epimerase n=1 Tax=Mycena chlorophos TaxID=658473 RepID=A0A8H6SXS2_MYCCL|nr:Peroxisomal hydratase-dehydrogenase-epimerase [Mycena chlorophos]